MNRRPLTSLERKESNHPLQARLEKLPFKPGSVDLMFLDFTLLFMNPIQVHNFFDEARKVLSENGLVLATYYNPGNACRWIALKIEKFLNRWAYLLTTLKKKTFINWHNRSNRYLMLSLRMDLIIFPKLLWLFLLNLVQKFLKTGLSLK